MIFGKATVLSVAASVRLNSYRGVRVKARRFKANVTWALNNNHFSCRPRLSSGCCEKRWDLFSSSERDQSIENVVLSAETRVSSRSVLAHFEQLAGIRQIPLVSSITLTGAQTGQHRETKPPLFRTSGNETWRLVGLGVGGPNLFTSETGRSAPPCSTTMVIMRASSTAAALKRETGVEDTAAELKGKGLPPDGGPSEPPQGPGEGKPNKAQQLKKVFKEYGAVGVTFHVGISLISLGICYLAISCGIDMTALLFKMGFSSALVQSKMAAGTSTFVLSYAVHKLFAPVRMSVTLVSVPLIVRYFRKAGLFKPPASTP